MRVAFFSPLPPTRSGIADYSQALLDPLGRLAEVETFSTGGREYHPLRHRNTVYVALNRLRQLLRELLPGREVVETASNGWRLSREVDICAIRSKRTP